MYTLLGNLRHAARLTADMRLSDLRYPINFVVKHQIPLDRGGPALRLLKPAAIPNCKVRSQVAACFQVEALFEEGAEL